MKESEAIVRDEATPWRAISDEKFFTVSDSYMSTIGFE